MFTQKFYTKKAATEYYGHTWAYIERHYKVTISYESTGLKGYFIEKIN